jgi:acyl-CoA synthetase (AMP-forming)/AMP-acid ligase II
VPTGDLGVFAQSGELVITGRRKDLIIRGGVNISPIAVEAVLAADPNVDECVAVGVPNEILGEVVAVAFRPASGRTVDQAVAALKQTCSKEFASSERPSYLLAMTEFPSTVTGKVQRNKVRDHVIEHLAEAVVLR